MGSMRMGPAFLMASLKPMDAAILKAISELSTSLEAAVQVKRSQITDPAMKGFTPQELADVCIVSRFDFVDELTLPRRFKDTETGIEAAGGFTEGAKCPRCWKYSDAADGEGLCPRCAAVLRGMAR